MRIKGLFPLDPYDGFTSDAEFIVSGKTPFMHNGKKIGRLVGLKPCKDLKNIEVEVELDEGVEPPHYWEVVGGTIKEDNNGANGSSAGSS